MGKLWGTPANLMKSPTQSKAFFVPCIQLVQKVMIDSMVPSNDRTALCCNFVFCFVQSKFQLYDVITKRL